MEELLFSIALFCVASFALLEHVSISIPLFSLVKMPLLLTGALCLVSRVKLLLENITKKRYFYILATLMLFCISLMIVAFVNRSTFVGSDPVRRTVRLVLFLVELFWLMIWTAETGRTKQVMDFLFWYVLIIVIATDLLLFTKAITFYSGRHENYLVGTKFVVSYLHMDLLTLWFVRNNMQLHREGKSKSFIFWGSLFILAVSIRVNCMTGVIGCIALFICFVLINTPVVKKVFQFRSPVLLVVFMLVCVTFPIVAGRLLSIPIVKDFVIDIFGRDETLTGRLGIYETFGEKMAGYWLQGYGYENATTSEMLFRCANTQNALLQWILEVGVPTTGLFVSVILLVFKQLWKETEQNRILPMVVLVYVYVVLGMVETTFNMRFIMWIALIFMHVNSKEPDVETEEEQE